jgi:AraC-like DNA-binding protein
MALFFRHNPGVPHVVEERFGLAAWAGQVEPMPHAHRHDDLEINVALGGRVVYRLAGKDVEIPAGSAAVFWADQPHQLVAADPQARLQWATVPAPLVARWEDGDGDPVAVGSEPLVVPDVMPLPDWWPSELASGDAVLSAAVELEVRAIVMRIVRRSGSRAPQGRESTAAARMARFMSSEFTRPLTVTDVAAAADLSVSQAMAVFRRDYGTTIGSYLTALRVAEAQRLLRTTTLTTDRVVLAAGFGSVSAGYDAFRRAAGEPPAQWRRRHTGSDRDV